MQHGFIRRSAVATTAVLACSLTLLAGIAGIAGTAAAATAPATTAPVSNVQVNLATVANVDGIFANGTVPTNGGLDTFDYALSANLIGSSITWSGVTFRSGAVGVPDAVSSATIALPAGNYTTLKLLALGMNGNQPDQTFVITYTDGTTAKVTQSVSDWWSPQNYSGESTALSMAYCVTPTGAQCPGPQALYGYSFAVNVAKTVKSLTLPANRNVVVVDAVLTGRPAVGSASLGSQVSFGSSANVYALANDGTAPTNGGLIGSDYAISKNLAGASIAWSGSTFTMGGAGIADAVSSTSVSLPAGKFTALKLVAVGARGNQVNQPFIVTYTDGTKTTVTQSISDWWGSSGNAGETTVRNMAYCVTPTGGKCSGPTAMYGYSFAIDGTKTVNSLTLPNNRDVVVLAAVLVGTAATTGDADLAFGAADYTVAQNANTAAVTVSRAGGSVSAVSVQYATVDGSGVAGSLYTATSGTLQWAANDTSSKTISVPVSNATPFLGSKSFEVTLSNPSSGATVTGSNSATVTVVGDGSTSPPPATALLTFSAANYPMSQSTQAATLVVNRSGASSNAVSVQYATADGSGVAGSLYTRTAGTLQWAANDTTAKSISVPVSNSTPFSGVKSFTVALSNPSADASLSSPNSATVTVTGDAMSTVQLSSASYTASQSAGAVTITATRNGASGGAVSVAYATANGTATAGTNYASTSGTLNWATTDMAPKSFNIVIDKTASTGSKTFTVALSAPAGGTLGSTTQATVTLTGTTTTPAAAFLNYAAALKSSGKVLVGQHIQYYEGNSNTESEAFTSVTPLYSQTGKLPAILGVTANWYGTSDPYNSSGGGQPDLNVVKQIITDWDSAASNSYKPEAGAGIIQINWGTVDPTGTSNGNFAPISSGALSGLVTPGSASSNKWVNDTQQLQTWLLSVVAQNPNVVLIVRLFAELNGNWYWYGVENSQTDVNNQIKLHQQTVDTLFAGSGASLRNNVLISYDANNYGGFGAAAAWPGKAYADVAGWDMYDTGWTSPVQQSTYNAFVGFDVPLIHCEVGITTGSGSAQPDYTVNDMIIPNFLRSQEPAVIGYVQWDDNGQGPGSSMSITKQNNADQVMNDPAIVTLSDLPAF